MGDIRNRLNQLWLTQHSGNVVYASGLVATPASGAPGAYAKLLANATATANWWLTAVVVGNLSAAAPTEFDYQLARAEDGSGTDLMNTLTILLEAATAALQKFLPLAFPIMVATGVGAAARQTSAAGATLDMTIQYATGVGS